MQLGGVVKPNDGHCYTANGRYTASTIMVRQSNSLAVSSFWYVDVKILTLNLILDKMQCKHFVNQTRNRLFPSILEQLSHRGSIKQGTFIRDERLIQP